MVAGLCSSQGLVNTEHTVLAVVIPYMTAPQVFEAGMNIAIPGCNQQ